MTSRPSRRPAWRLTPLAAFLVAAQFGALALPPQAMGTPLRAPVAACSFGVAVHAIGFQYMPPSDPPPAYPAPQTPAPQTLAAPSGPRAITITPLSSAPTPSAQMPVTQIPAAPLPPAPTAPRNAPTSVVTAGTGVPLAIAIRQIVPAIIATSYGAGVNPMELVSWTGDGRDWQSILSDAVTKVGYTATFSSGRVSITSGQPLDGKTSSLLKSQVTKISIHTQTAFSSAAENRPHLTRGRYARPIARPSIIVGMMPVAAKQIRPAPPPPIVITPSTPRVSAAEMESRLNEIRVWRIPVRTSVQQILTQWSDQIGARHPDAIEHDYVTGHDDEFEGTFLDAVEYLIDGFKHLSPQIDWWYSGPSRVVILCEDRCLNRH
jgi:hypothetical protein